MHNAKKYFKENCCGQMCWGADKMEKCNRQRTMQKNTSKKIENCSGQMCLGANKVVTRKKNIHRAFVL